MKSARKKRLWCHVALKIVVHYPRGQRHRHHSVTRIYILEPNQENTMTDNVSVGHQIDYSFLYVDTSGNPMKAPIVPDSPPVWANAPASPPVDAFTRSADGATAVLQASAPGADTVTLTVVVAGVTYTGSDQVLISAAPQVLGGVQIVAKVV